MKAKHDAYMELAKHTAWLLRELQECQKHFFAGMHQHSADRARIRELEAEVRILRSLVVIKEEPRNA